MARTPAKVLVAYSGGPDAAALTIKLKEDGFEPVPAYILYRQYKKTGKLITGGGKVSIDLRHAGKSLSELGQDPDSLIKIEAPLNDWPKSLRNHHFIPALARKAKEIGASTIALGTYEKTDTASGAIDSKDLNKQSLDREASKNGVRLITWDDYGISSKAGEFKSIEQNDRNLAAIFATWSSQSFIRSPRQCGRCFSCQERHSAFMEAFGQDPTDYYWQP